VSEEGVTTVEDGVPLNLRVFRAPVAKAEPRGPRQAIQLLGLVTSGVLLLAASRRRGRFVIPAAAALATGSIAALATIIVARRRRTAREARIDERIEQSFPASDPPAR
jgi:hypothetical protein